MPVFEKTSGGEVFLRGIGRRVAVGERVEADDDFADYLRERGDFRVADDHRDAEFREVEDGEGDDSDAAGSEDFSANGWLENDYQDRAEAVREGGLDDHLDEIEEAETSQTVLDAVEERRAELEE